MAETIPINFPIPQETAITSYPYSDIREGTGIVRFRGVRLQIDNNSANDVYSLVTDSGIVSVKDGATVVTSGSSLDFDVTFNTPKIIDGNCIIYIPIYWTTAGAAATITPKVTVIHYDGSSETTLLAQTTFQTGTGSIATADEWGLRVDIPRTHFKICETLRFTIEFATGGAAATYYLFHIPGASSTTYFPLGGGALSFFVPFRLDL